MSVVVSSTFAPSFRRVSIVSKWLPYWWDGKVEVVGLDDEQKNDQDKTDREEKEKIWLFEKNLNCKNWNRNTVFWIHFYDVILQFTVSHINQKPRRKYWHTRSSIRSFTRTADSFACSALLASLALTRLLALSLRSLPSSWDSE